MSAVRGEITTLEGLAKNGKLHPLQQAWIDEQAPQCGYCQNGQIMTAKALLDRNPNPSDAEIREAMDGALCRCMTYYRVQAAIKRVVRGAKDCRRRQMSNALQLPKAVEDAILGLNQAVRVVAPQLPQGFGRAGHQPERQRPARRQRARSRKPAVAAGPYPDPDFLQLDTWIVIHPDNTATFFVGKTDGGQGTGTAFRQMMCDELDIAYDKTSLVMGCTDITPDQGGSGGSDARRARWLADAPGGRRSAAGAAGAGRPAPGRAGRTCSR